MPPFWIINGALFQLAWFSAALFTEYAAVLILSVLVLHFALSKQVLDDLKLLLIAPIGVITDATLMYYQVFYADTETFPLWLALLWSMLVLCINYSLNWLTKLHVLWISLIGAIAGPASYIAAIRFEALQSNLPYPKLVLILAFTWALLLPVLVKLSTQVISMQSNQQNHNVN